MQYERFTHQYWLNEAIVGTGFPPKVGLSSSEKPLHAKLPQETDIPVCALIIKDNKLISCSTNQIESCNNATLHAEIIAIREASKALGNWRLHDCTLYVTLEPCSMCAGAIINSRISRVVFGAYDINFGACGSKINLFYELGKHKQVEIIGGILEKEAAKILKDFFRVKP